MNHRFEPELNRIVIRAIVPEWISRNRNETELHFRIALSIVKTKMTEERKKERTKRRGGGRLVQKQKTIAIIGVSSGKKKK